MFPIHLQYCRVGRYSYSAVQYTPLTHVPDTVAVLYSTLDQYCGKIKKLDYENLKRQEDIKTIINDPGKSLTENDKGFLSLQQVLYCRME